MPLQDRCYKVGSCAFGAVNEEHRTIEEGLDGLHMIPLGRIDAGVVERLLAVVLEQDSAPKVTLAAIPGSM